MQKTKWFSPIRKPTIPGVYLTRSPIYPRANRWWRAFDGSNWHVGYLAVDSCGNFVVVSPTYEECIMQPVLGEHIIIEWCGVIPE